MNKLRRAITILSFLVFSACNPSPDKPSSIEPGSIQVATTSPKQTRPSPPPTITDPVIAAPSVEDGPLSVIDQIFFFDRNGTLHIIGLVHNHSEQALANIQVAIQVKDAQGQTLTQATVPISTDPLFPGERTVFIQDFLDISTASLDITTEIVAFKLASSGRVDLNINHDSLVRAGEFLYVIGEILNTLSVPIYIENLSAALFDQDGHLQAADTWELGSHYLEPGETGPFRIPIEPNNHQIQPSDTYEIYYQAEKGPLTQPTGLSFQGQPEYFVDSQGIFHLLAYVSNDSEDTLHPYLLATIYDPQGNLIDTSQSTLFGLPLSPGETLPVDYSNWMVLNSQALDLDPTWQYALQWDPQWTRSSSHNWISLDCQFESQWIEDGILSVQGLLSNPGDLLVSGYKILARVWNPIDGSTLALITQENQDTLPGGQSIPFTLEATLPPEADDLDLAIELIAKGQAKE